MTPEEKIKIYEGILYDLYYASSVAMNHEWVMRLLDLIARWSRAHSCGNGELSWEEQESLINEALMNIKNRNQK